MLVGPGQSRQKQPRSGAGGAQGGPQRLLSPALPSPFAGVSAAGCPRPARPPLCPAAWRTAELALRAVIPHSSPPSAARTPKVILRPPKQKRRPARRSRSSASRRRDRRSPRPGPEVKSQHAPSRLRMWKIRVGSRRRSRLF